MQLFTNFIDIMYENSKQKISKNDLDKIISAIDSINEKDPTLNHEKVPKELAYSRYMTQMLAKIYPETSAELKIAVHAHHIQRWEKPRKDWPEGRIGYLKWRKDMYKFHAQKTNELLKGMPESQIISISKVSDLIQKKNMTTDKECIALEDTACLVFLKHYFHDFIEPYNDEKIITIVQKTWKRMSSLAQAATSEISFNERATKLLKKALADV